MPLVKLKTDRWSQPTSFQRSDRYSNLYPRSDLLAKGVVIQYVQPEPMKLRERGGLRPLKFDEVDYDEASLKTLNGLLAKI